MNKTVVILGSNGLIAKAIAEEISGHDDWRVLPVDTEEWDFSSRDSMVDFEAYISNLKTDDEEVDFVYNAGVDRLDWMDKQDWDDIQECVDVNMLGLLRTLRGFSKNPRAKRFVHVCSISATVPQTNTIAYNSSKAGARMASMAAARELAPKGKFINIVSPGPVSDTEMTNYVTHRVPYLRGWGFDEAEDRQMSVVPLRRRIRPDEVASAVGFLLDENKSGAMVGAEIRVSGGL